MTNTTFNRSELLLGTETMRRMAAAKVILFGVGGVGSWCAESLVRTGFKHITIVDPDLVCTSNCNRQLMATNLSIGMPKVEALKRRLLEINPTADITALQQVYNKENASSFQLESYDFIVDAIDSLQDKAALILHATNITHSNRNALFISSMGAALHIDPTKVRVAEFWKIQGDPLARALRNKFKEKNTFPESKFLCVYSEEHPLKNKGENAEESIDTSSLLPHKRNVNGSICPITAIFGMTIAGVIIQTCHMVE